MVKHDAAFCQQMIDRAKTALREAPVGVTSWSIGGESISYGDLKADLDYWQNQLNVAAGRSAGIVSLDLS